MSKIDASAAFEIFEDLGAEFVIFFKEELVELLRMSTFEIRL